MVKKLMLIAPLLISSSLFANPGQQGQQQHQQQQQCQRRACTKLFLLTSSHTQNDTGTPTGGLLKWEQEFVHLFEARGYYVVPIHQNDLSSQARVGDLVLNVSLTHNHEFFKSCRAEGFLKEVRGVHGDFVDLNPLNRAWAGVRTLIFKPSCRSAMKYVIKHLPKAEEVHTIGD